VNGSEMSKGVEHKLETLHTFPFSFVNGSEMSKGVEHPLLIEL